MKTHLKFVGTLLSALAMLILGALSPALAQDNSERLELARKYLKSNIETMDIDKLAAISSSQILAVVKRKQPDVYAQKKDRLNQITTGVIKTAITTAMNGLDVKLAETFSLTELKALNEFYGSETGRSILKKMPRYMAALQPAIQAGIRKALPDLIRQLGREGVSLR